MSARSRFRMTCPDSRGWSGDAFGLQRGLHGAGLAHLNAEKLEGPSILFWNDSRNDGGLDEWITSFTNLGLQPGRDFDLYNPRAASTGMGEGLGAVLTPELLDVYDVICYSGRGPRHVHPWQRRL